MVDHCWDIDTCRMGMYVPRSRPTVMTWSWARSSPKRPEWSEWNTAVGFAGKEAVSFPELRCFQVEIFPSALAAHRLLIIDQQDGDFEGKSLPISSRDFDRCLFSARSHMDLVSGKIPAPETGWLAAGLIPSAHLKCKIELKMGSFIKNCAKKQGRVSELAIWHCC